MVEADYALHRCVEVAPGLLCGSMRALKHVESLNVTHVLSVYNFEVAKLSRDIEHLHFQIYDEDSADILMILQRAHGFIEEGLKIPSGRVLVHCFAGMSRSVTVVVSYLMKERDMTVEQALHYMDERYPHACPNSGFLHQLEIFRRSRYDYAVASEALMQERNPKKKSNDGRIKIVRRHSQKPEHAASSQVAMSGLDFSFECRRCRRLLGTASSVHDAASIDLFSESGSMFVEQLDWMNDQCCRQEVAGKLYCPSCNEKLGSFDWSGISDDIVWHVPGFQLHLNKLDVRSSTDDTGSVLHHPKLDPPSTTLSSTPPGTQSPTNIPRPGLDPISTTLSSTPPGTSLRDQRDKGFEFFVFDCDGVLVDTEIASCESLRLGILDATGFDIPHKFPEDYAAVFGMDVRSCVQYYNDTFRRDWSDIDALACKVSQFKEHHYIHLTDTHGIHSFDGIPSFIDRLHSLNLPVGIASSGHPSKLSRNLQSSGLISKFDARSIVSASEVDKGKPFPDVYLEVFRRIGCSECPERCLVLEDSINGLKSAKAAGAYAVGITHSLPEALLKPHADLVIDHVRELERLLPGER